MPWERCSADTSALHKELWVWGYRAVLLPPHPGFLPTLSFMGLNCPTLPLLMFLVPLGWMHRVPGRLQQEKGQQSVKPFLVYLFIYYMLFITGETAKLR